MSEVRQKRLSASKSFVTSAGEASTATVVSARKTGAAGPTESNLYLPNFQAVPAVWLPRGVSKASAWQGNAVVLR